MEVAAPVAAGRAGAVMAEEAMAEEVMFRTRLVPQGKAERVHILVPPSHILVLVSKLK